mmetsp:Transcript_14608/g.33588  ORF Transcript_14608/g.33588 Transcript_14608/m.33588 type:complete len:400 (-) Transcript_14608:213-1412(-)
MGASIMSLSRLAASSSPRSKLSAMRMIGVGMRYLVASLTAAGVVATPSATPCRLWALSSKICVSFLPRPSSIPTFLFRESPPRHVSIRSPIPASPFMVCSWPPIATANRFISLHPRVTRSATALMPRPRPSATPARMAMTFFRAPPTCTPITSSLGYTRIVGPLNRCASFLLMRMSWLASTAPLGVLDMMSWAKVGPERKATGWFFRPSAFGMISCIISRVSVCKPLEVDTMGTSGSILSFIFSRYSLVDCRGMQWTMKLVFLSATSASVVAVRFSGSLNSLRWVGFRCSVLIPSATSSRRVSTTTSNPLRATSVAIAIPKDPLPNTVTFISPLSWWAPSRLVIEAELFMVFLVPKVFRSPLSLSLSLFSLSVASEPWLKLGLASPYGTVSQGVTYCAR